MTFMPMPFIKRAAAALVGLVLAAALAAGTSARAQSGPEVSQFVLDNGLTVIVQPDHRSPTAVHMLWVRTGAMDEVDGTSGVAHALEHMMFKGTDKLAPGEFSRRVAQMGGLENAFTASDYTAYFQQIPADKLAQAMALEADRFAHNQYSDAEFKKEIQVVMEERRMRTEDNPRALLREQQMAAAFIASPYHRPVVGWMADLQSMTADDVRAFYEHWYAVVLHRRRHQRPSWSGRRFGVSSHLRRAVRHGGRSHRRRRLCHPRGGGVCRRR